jgi:mRNA interferase RelE/StbE
MTASYELRFSKSFDRDIRKIDHKLVPWVVGKILALEQNPRPLQSKKLKGAGDEYRLRIGSYRAFYTIDDESKVIVIFHITHRRDAYRQKDHLR